MKNRFLLLLLLAGGTATAQVAVTVNTAANRQPISPYIYGLNPYHYDNSVTGMALHDPGIRPASMRFGGDAVSTYNWEKNVNTSYDGSCGSTYSTNANNRFLSYAAGVPASQQSQTAGAILKFYADAAALGTYPLVQLTAMQYAANDATGCLSTACGQGTGSGRFVRSFITKPGALSTSPSLTDTVQYADEELNFLRQQPGIITGPHGYCLENEPGIWNGTHPCAHAQRATCGEVLSKNIELAKRIRTLDPNSEIMGPSMYGFTEYTRLNYTNAQNNPSDWNTYNMSDTVFTPAVYNYMTWICSYLRQMRNAGITANKRLLDVLDLHYYQEGDNRSQDSRSFWDSSYVENSYITNQVIGGASIKLVHCVKRAIADWYPNTRIGITEWGHFDNDNGDNSTGVYVADMLGAFGKYGVYTAQYFGRLKGFTASAQKLFRNFNGNGGQWGNTSVSAGSADNSKITAYASIMGTNDSEVHVMIINRSTSTQTASVQLHANRVFSFGQVWEMSGTGSGAVSLQPGITNIANNSFSYTLGAKSVAHIILQNGVAGIADVAKADLKVYPNPATDRLFVTGLLQAETAVTVWDLLGRQVLQASFEAANQSAGLDIARLPAGQYIVQLGEQRAFFEKR